MIVSRTPLRITIGGGGTDLPSFYEKHGGFVLSMAINKYIYITFKPDDFEPLLKLRYSQIEIVDHVSQLKHHRAKEALIMHGIENGCEINSCADIPSNTGLGSSGTFLVGLLNAIREHRRLDHGPHVLAEEACNIEINRLGEPVGKQDQFIAAYGGLKILRIQPDGQVNVGCPDMSYSDLQHFLTNVHVYYLNIKRDASDILSDQKSLKGNSEDILKTVKQFGYESLIMLENGQFDDYGYQLDEYWQLKKKLSNKISIGAVDKLYERLKDNFAVLGGKIIGAGGGGFFMLYVQRHHQQVEEYMATQGYKRLHYNLDDRGSTICGNF